MNSDMERLVKEISDSAKNVQGADDRDLQMFLTMLGLDVEPSVFKKVVLGLTEKTITFIRSLDETESKIAVVLNRIGSAAFTRSISSSPQLLKPGQVKDADMSHWEDRADEVLARVKPSGEVETTAVIEMLEARLGQLYQMRRGKILKHPGRPPVDPEDVEAWCGQCGRNVVRPSDGEDTCHACLRNV